MLVLSRKEGEKLVIDGGITVQVIRIEGKKIKLGFQAPSEVKILRGELVNRPKAGVQAPETPQSLEIVIEQELQVA
jgi:carbon storage regulator CsrA